MTIKKIKELDTDNLLTDEQRQKLKAQIKDDVPDEDVKMLIKFIGVNRWTQNKQN